MEATTSVGLIIVGGAGQRGKSALEILPRLQTAVRGKGIGLELLCIAEAKEELRAALGAQAAELLGYPCPVVGLLAEAIAPALRWLANGQGQRKAIVYDASPAAHHYLHLMIVLPHSEREQIYYLGEKPLFTEPGQIEFVQQTFSGQTFFCEFIETENPAFKAARDFIRSEGFEIQRMSFWRASCIGVSIAAGDGRGGIEGGALLDKTPHDLSVSLGLVGADSVKLWYVNQVRTHLLALPEDAFRLNRRNFLSVASTSIEDINSPARIPERLPADALVSFDADFTLHGNMTIPISYIASWVGMQSTKPEMRLSEQLAALAMDRKEWVSRDEPRVSRNSGYRYASEEVRISLIEGVLKNRKVYLVLNLLGKKEGGRFVYLIGEDRGREILFEEKSRKDYHERKDEDLLEVFQRVMEHCAGLSHAENLATEASLLVHKIMLSALEKANEQLCDADQGQAYEASLQAYRKYVVALESSH